MKLDKFLMIKKGEKNSKKVQRGQPVKVKLMACGGSASLILTDSLIFLHFLKGYSLII